MHKHTQVAEQINSPGPSRPALHTISSRVEMGPVCFQLTPPPPLCGQVPREAAVSRGGALESPPVALSSGSSAGLRRLPQQPLQPQQSGPRGVPPHPTRLHSARCSQAQEQLGMGSPGREERPPMIYPTPLTSVAPHFSQSHKNPFLFSGSPDGMGPQRWAGGRWMSAQAARGNSLDGKAQPSSLCMSLHDWH